MIYNIFNFHSKMFKKYEISEFLFVMHSYLLYQRKIAFIVEIIFFNIIKLVIFYFQFIWKKYAQIEIFFISDTIFFDLYEILEFFNVIASRRYLIFLSGSSRCEYQSFESFVGLHGIHKWTLKICSGQLYQVCWNLKETLS